jgi:predicted GNAT family acetyltransferase
VLIQADAHAGGLAAAAVRHSGRRVTGLLGASEQVAEAREALGLGATPAKLDSNEILMALSLDQLAIPAALRDGTLAGRLATASDRAALIPWRATYVVETGVEAAGPAADARAASALDGALAARRLWVVERDGAVVAMCAHNAELPDAGQVGGVFTPAPLRGRGHARAAVATSLLDARARGVARAILFTPRPDAVAAYRAIGFEPIGRYAIVLYA